MLEFPQRPSLFQPLWLNQQWANKRVLIGQSTVFHGMERWGLNVRKWTVYKRIIHVNWMTPLPIFFYSNSTRIKKRGLYLQKYINWFYSNSHISQERHVLTKPHELDCSGGFWELQHVRKYLWLSLSQKIHEIKDVCYLRKNSCHS